jgi:hypothetical protein
MEICCGEYGGGAHYPTPCGRLGAGGRSDHCPASGTHSEAYRGEGCCPSTVTRGGALGSEEPETKADRHAPFWVSRRTMKIVFSCEALLFTDILPCFSIKRRAHELSFTTTKAVKRGAGTSTGASSHPTPPRRLSGWPSPPTWCQPSPIPPRPRRLPWA